MISNFQIMEKCKVQPVTNIVFVCLGRAEWANGMSIYVYSACWCLVRWYIVYVYVSAYLLLHNILNLLFCLLEIMLMPHGSEFMQLTKSTMRMKKKKKYNVGILNPEVKNKSNINECSQRVDTIIFHFFYKRIITVCQALC